MIALGLLCLLVAAAAVLFALFEGSGQEVEFSFFAGDFVTRPAWVFAAGAATLLLVVIGLGLFRRGTKRKVSQRREIKRLRKVEETSGPGSTNTGSTNSGSTNTGSTNTGSGLGTDGSKHVSTHKHDDGVSHSHEDSPETLVRDTRRPGDGTRQV